MDAVNHPRRTHFSLDEIVLVGRSAPSKCFRFMPSCIFRLMGGSTVRRGNKQKPGGL